jgi:hypothetical protein
MGRLDAPKNGSELCYSRCALLQLSPRCLPKDATSNTLDSSPWFSGLLYCLPVNEVSDPKSRQTRPRAASDERAKPSRPNTLVLKNIPSEYTRTGLCEELAKHGFGYAIDFLYLPIKASTGQNVGHCFVNLRSKEVTRDFIDTFQNVSTSECLPAFESTKVCQVCIAEVQGREANMKKCSTASNLKKWEKHEDWQPLFLDDYGGRIPMSEWKCTNDQAKPERPASTKNSPALAPKPSPVLRPSSASGMQASAPEFVPQMESLYCVSPSPQMRPDAAEFVPSSVVFEMLPEAAEIHTSV